MIWGWGGVAIASTLGPSTELEQAGGPSSWKLCPDVASLWPGSSAGQPGFCCVRHCAEHSQVCGEFIHLNPAVPHLYRSPAPCFPLSPLMYLFLYVEFNRDITSNTLTHWINNHLMHCTIVDIAHVSHYFSVQFGLQMITKTTLNYWQPKHSNHMSIIRYTPALVTTFKTVSLSSMFKLSHVLIYGKVTACSFCKD